jgi:ligand-binding SRPBCC domain-containing protein
LTTELWLPRPRAEVFAFFSDAGNLDVLTPPWLHFHIRTPRPIALHAGARIEYRLRWRGIPLSWRTEISVWDPPHSFVDRQVRGPYRRWVHEHTFEERDGGTLLRDRVDYAVPGWLLEPLVHSLVVGPDVRRIFAYRRLKMQELFAV